MIYLYIKTHNITGLKYLGKTEKNPETYQGSGKYWCRHIKKYNYDVTTEIIYQSENKDDIKSAGIYYSLFYDVVKSKEWANLVMEEGNGGDTSNSLNFIKAKDSGLLGPNKGLTYEQIYGIDKSIILKLSRTNSNIKRGKRSSITKNKISKTRIKLIKEGKIQSAPSQEILTCPHCGFKTTIGNAHRWHFSNCKSHIL